MYYGLECWILNKKQAVAIIIDLQGKGVKIKVQIIYYTGYCVILYYIVN